MIDFAIEGENKLSWCLKKINLCVTSCVHTAPQIKLNALTLADRGLNAACSEGVAVATRSLSRGEGSCHC